LEKIATLAFLRNRGGLARPGQIFFFLIHIEVCESFGQHEKCVEKVVNLTVFAVITIVCTWAVMLSK